MPLSIIKLIVMLSRAQFCFILNFDLFLCIVPPFHYIIINMNSNQALQPKTATQFKLPPQLHKYSFSEEMFSALQKLLKYDHDIVITLSSNDLRDILQKQLARLQNIKTNSKISSNIYLDTQLSLMIMANQMRALLDLNNLNNENVKKLSLVRKRLSSDLEQPRESVTVRRYEGIASEIQKYQDQINKFMQNDVINKTDINLVSCYSFFRRITKKLTKNNSQKLISSWGYLLSSVTYLLGEVLKKYSPEVQPEHDDDQVELEQANGAQFGDLSYEQINKWKRMASRIIEEKLVELAGICQQIPQLETFNRNLQFSQLQNRQKIIILKIVDVIISLHHRVSYLSRNKPQLLRQLQYVQQQIQIFNNTCTIFLQHLEVHSTNIRSIRFQGEVRKNNSLTQAFLLLRKHIMKMSEIIVNGEQYHSNNMKRLMEFILLFVRAFTGHGESSEEWEQLVQDISNSNESQISEDQYEIIMQLQECIIEHHNKIAYLQQMDQQSNTKTNQELEEEVNKLISDFQRLKGENKQHLQNLDLLSKLREELEMEIEERDNMIYNLSTIKVTLEKKILNQQGASNHSNRAVQEQLKKQEHQTQKYLESSLLLRQQLKVSENQREKLLELIERQKEKNIKLLQNHSKCKSQKERLQLENQELVQKIEKNKNDQLRQTNKLNKQINDITNQRDLLEIQLKTAEANNAKLMDRLELNQKKLLEYSKLAIIEEKQQKNQRQYKSQAEIERLQAEIERYRREVERVRKEIQNKRIQMEIFEQENNSFKQENILLKNKMKQIRLFQEEIQEKDQTIKELKTKLEKNAAKISTLTKENEELREQQEKASNKYKYSAKRVKQLEGKLSQVQSNSSQLILEIQLKNNSNIDLQKQVTAQTNQYSTQIKFYKDMNAKQDEDLKLKDERIQNLQRKIEKLEQQLSQKQQRNEESNKQLVQMKVKQYQSTIETHKLIELKLQEQAQSLKTQLEQKIQVEIKLNFEIDKLSKQIEKLKDLLQRYMRDITQKQFIIKKERERYEQQVKIIRDFEIKEKIYQENQTPIRNDGKRNREEDTIDDRENSNNKKKGNQEHDSNLDNSMSRSNAKYDIFFNAKEYDRLLKEYNDYKTLMTSKYEELQRLLDEARKSKIDLQIRIHNLQLQNKKVINSKFINNGNANQNRPNNSNQSTNEPNHTYGSHETKEIVEILQMELAESKSVIVKYQIKINEINILISNFQDKIKKLEEENSLLYARLKKSKEISELKISELQSIIKSISNTHQQCTHTEEMDSLRKDKQRLSQQLAKATQLFNTQRQANTIKEVEQFKRTIQLLNDQINKILQQKSRDEANRVQITKERDEILRKYQEICKKYQEIRRQYQEIRRDESRVQQSIVESNNYKKIIEHYQNQIELYRQQLKIQREKNKVDPNFTANLNIQFYLQKIRSLQFALAAVGEELSDAKQALSRQRNAQGKQNSNNKELQIMFQDNKKLYSDNQYLSQANMQLKMQIQSCIRSESQWKSREAIYLKDLQIISRQNIYLKDTMSKGEKQVVTNLPNNINPININYHDPNTNEQSQATQGIDVVIRQMDVIIEGKMRWQGTRLIESLQRWRVPLIIHKEIEDLLNYLSHAVELIKSIRLEYINIRNVSPNNLLFTNLLQLVFRILVYFSEIDTNSAEATKIRSQIDEIAKKYSGGIFFTVLQEFTIHILQNNAIEQYKRELKEKAKQLLQIKQKLDELITRQIEQEEKILSKPIAHRSRDTTPYRESHSASPRQ